MRLLLLIVLFTMCTLFAKNEQPEVRTAKQIEKVEAYIYSLAKDLFKRPKMEYLAKEYDTPWDETQKHSTRILKRALEHVADKATISLTDGLFGRRHIELDVEFPKNMNDLEGVCHVSLVSTKIHNSKGTRVRFNTTGKASWSERDEAGWNNGESYNHIWEHMKVFFQSKEKPGNQLKGDVEFLGKCRTSYDKVLLTSKSKGKKFTLGSSKFRVISVSHNRIILETKTKNYTEFDFVNLHKNGKAYVKMSFGEHQIRGGHIAPLDYRKVAVKRIQTVDKNIYKAFTKKPKMGLKAFKRKFHKDLVKSIKKGTLEDNVYIVLESAAPIKNFYLFTPKYSITKSIEKTGLRQ